jgi:hypothetical protein
MFLCSLDMSTQATSRHVDPLAIIEAYVGNVSCWPTFVIHDLFLTDPRDGGLRDISTFLCGNGVPILLAIDCVTACNSWPQMKIWSAVHIWYGAESTTTCDNHWINYYSVQRQCMVWFCNRHCYCSDEMGPADFGFGDRSNLLQGIIAFIRAGRRNF